jgi:lysophospholipase L1-like esterase
VAGDSITRILSPAKMTDANVNVRVKTHPGGKVSTVENTISKLSQTDPEFVKNLDVVVLHVGTNNVSSAASSEQIITDFKNTIQTLSFLNSKVKIVVSSILPRRNGFQINKKISQTNKELQRLCSVNGYHFIDNYVNLGYPSQYRDNIHLNPQGGRALGENIRYAIDTVLGLSTSSSTTSSTVRNENGSFQKGRSPGRRNYHMYQRQRHIYPMSVPSYWMGEQSPWPMAHHAWY